MWHILYEYLAYLHYIAYPADIRRQHVSAAPAVRRVELPLPLLFAHVVLVRGDPLGPAGGVQAAVQGGAVADGDLVVESERQRL